MTHHSKDRSVHAHAPSRPQKAIGAMLTATVLLALLCGGQPVSGQDAADRERALEILRSVPFFDGHNDIPWQYRTRVRNRIADLPFGDTTQVAPAMHTDILRLRESGIGAQFWSVYIPTSMAGPGATRAVLEQIDVAVRLTERHGDVLELALTAADVRRIHAAGKIASLLGMEGGHAIEESLAALRQLYVAGARYMTLTHSANTPWADSSTDEPEHNGLTPFGEEVVREMNRLGMLVDLSHVAPTTMHDALDVTEAPVIFSHSSAYAVTQHPRNVPDDVLKRVAENRGVVMVTFVPAFVNDEVRAHSDRMMLELQQLRASGRDEGGLIQWRRENPPPSATLADVADHIDHIRKLIGVEFIGIGSDYDGITSVPVGLEDVSKIPELFVELLHRGYSEEDLEKIAGHNLLRVMDEAEEVAERLQQERPPSELVIETNDG